MKIQTPQRVSGGEDIAVPQSYGPKRITDSINMYGWSEKESFGNHLSMNDKLSQMHQIFSLMYYSLKAKLSWPRRGSMCVLLPWVSK